MFDEEDTQVDVTPVAADVSDGIPVPVQRELTKPIGSRGRGPQIVLR